MSMSVSLRSLKDLTAVDISLDQAVAAHLRMITINCSEKTKRQYRYVLQRFVSDMGDRPLADLFDVDLLDWYAALADRKLSPFTFASYVQAVKRLFTWLHTFGILSVDLANSLDLPDIPRGTRKGISDNHAQAILDAASSNVRDFAILNFLDSTACRRSGLADLRLADLSLDAPLPRCRRARVREKGNPERTVLMTNSAMSALRAWLVERPQVADDHVFLGRSPGKPWLPLQPESIRAMINRYASRLGIDGPVSPHQWRHRTSRRRIREGLPFKVVSQLNGHSMAVCERYYSDLEEEDLIALFESHAR